MRQSLCAKSLLVGLSLGKTLLYHVEEPYREKNLEQLCLKIFYFTMER